MIRSTAFPSLARRVGGPAGAAPACATHPFGALAHGRVVVIMRGPGGRSRGSGPGPPRPRGDPGRSVRRRPCPGGYGHTSGEDRYGPRSSSASGTRPLWARRMGAIEVTGHDRVVRAGDEQADPRLELAQLAGGRSGALGEEDQGIPRLLEELTAEGQAMPGTALPVERQGVDHDRGQQDARGIHEEVILRGGREGAMQPSTSAMRRAGRGHPGGWRGWRPSRTSLPSAGSRGR